MEMPSFSDAANNSSQKSEDALSFDSVMATSKISMRPRDNNELSMNKKLQNMQRRRADKNFMMEDRVQSTVSKTS